MKLKQVVFLPQNIATRLNPDPNWALISIRCPGDNPVFESWWETVLSLEFHDIERVHAGYKSFEYEQAVIVIKFLREIVASDDVDTLIVHCAAGISRSAAVAMFAQENFAERKYKLLGTERHNKLVKSMLDYQLKQMP